MDKKKRILESNQLSAPPKKKQLLDLNLQNEEASKPVEPHVLQHQHKAMLVKIQEKNVEITNLNNRLKKFETKQSTFDDTLSIVDRIWNQLMDSFNLLLGKVDNSVDISQVCPHREKQSPSSLIGLITKHDIKEELQSSNIEEDLQNRLEKGHKLLLRLIEVIEREKINSEELIEVIKKGSTDGNMKALTDNITKISGENSHLKNFNDEMHAKFKQLTKQYDQCESQKVKIEEKLNTIKDEMLDLQDSLSQMNKKYFKLEAKYNEDVRELKTQLSNSINNANNITNMNNNETKEIKTENDNKMDTSSTTQISNDELSDMKEILKGRENQIEKLTQEVTSLNRDNTTLRREASFMSDEKILKSRTYLVLDQKFSHVVSEVEHYKLLLDKLKKDFDYATSNYKNDKDKYETQYETRKEELMNRIKEAEDKANRYRRERDHLNQKLDAKGGIGVTNKDQVTQELKLLLNSKEIEIKKFKEQIEVLKEDSNKLKNIKEETKKSQEKLLENLDSNALEIRELKLTNIEQKRTISDLTSRKKRWEEKERELRVLLDVFQTSASTADRRELVEIRAAERKLLEEREILVSSNNERENRINVMEQKFNDEVNAVKKELGGKILKLERVLTELKSSSDGHTKERDGLYNEIESISKAFEDLQDQNTRLANQLVEREDNLSKLLAEQMKATMIENNLKEEKAAVNELITKSNEKCAKQDEAMKKMDQKCRQLQDIHRKQGEEIKMYQNMCEGLKKSARDNSQNCSDMKVQIERLEKELTESRNRADEKTKDAERESSRTYKLDEEISILRRKLERANSKKGDQSDDDLMIALRDAKSKLTCNVCNDRPKDVVIARCFHMFCKACIQKNLDFRHRKCPGCGKAFAETDVHPIYF